MNVVIVEDEKLATERLQTLLKQYDPSVRITACLESIEEAVQYLKHYSHPDVMMLDIHLSDGHSFEIFKQVGYNKPVIFTTAYDQYAIEAFKMFSIDYILKPVTQESLATALNKLKAMSASFNTIDIKKLQPLWEDRQYKKRFIGKVGQRLFFIDAMNISFFQADNKVVHIIDKEGNRYLAEYTMDKLERELDPKLFFRLNRSIIVNIDSIKQVKPYFNSRLKLSVKGVQNADEIIISRERVADFKQWASG